MGLKPRVKPAARSEETMLRHAKEDERAPKCECGLQMEYVGQEKASNTWQRYAYRCACGKSKGVMRERK